MFSQHISTNNKEIDVIFIFKAKGVKFKIYKVRHNNIEYLIDKVGFNYDKKIGNTRYHVFGVQSGNTFLKLSFNTKTLTWRMLEINYSP